LDDLFQEAVIQQRSESSVGLMTKASFEREVMTPEEVATILGTGLTKVRGWINKGELTAHNLASSNAHRPRWRITRSELDEFLQRRTNSQRVMRASARSRTPVQNHSPGFIRFFPEI
jgi:excisionase family DNA binding protein